MGRNSRMPSPERLIKAALRDQRRAFRKKFGRDPGPSDPVFFDADVPGDTPQPIAAQQLEDGILAAMRRAVCQPQ